MHSSVSSTSSKSYTEKLDESITGSSSGTEDPELDQELPESDLEDFINVPVIKQEDNAKLLPKYTSIISKNSEEAVGMDDLDLLQYDLETLLSTNALRTRFLLGEDTQPDNDDKKTNDNKALKRKMPEFEESKHAFKILKTDRFRPNEYTYKEIPKIKLPRNSSFDKFWATVEPYCAPIGKDNLAFLDTLLQESAQAIDTNIPEVGEHYTKLLSDELIDDEEIFCQFPNYYKLRDNKNQETARCLESLGSKKTQSLLAATIHDKVVEAIAAEAEAAEAEAKAEAETTSHTETGETEKADVEADKIKPTKASQPTQHRSDHGYLNIDVSLDKRLANVLIEEGILTKEDVKMGPDDDNLVKEIKKCREELLTVNDYNIVELNKLRSAVVNDIQCNELKDQLDKVNKQVLELYNSYVVAKLGDEGKDKEISFKEPMQPEFESKANELLRQRYVLNRKINNMADMSYYC